MAVEEETMDQSTSNNVFDMEDYQYEMSELMETQESVEKIANLCLKHRENRKVVDTIVADWIRRLRSPNVVERMSLLYLANHILQMVSRLHGHATDASTSRSSLTSMGSNSSTNGSAVPLYKEKFKDHLEEGISIVCNQPSNRDNTTRLLNIWEELNIFDAPYLYRLWQKTGEEIPKHLVTTEQQTQEEGTEHREEQQRDKDEEKESDSQSDESPSTEEAQNVLVFPSSLEKKAANEVINYLILLNMCHCRYLHLDNTLRRNYPNFLKKSLLKAEHLPEDALEATRKELETCMEYLFLRNQYMEYILSIQKVLNQTIEENKEEEEENAETVNKRIELCDHFDVILYETKEHRKEYAREWEEEKKKADAENKKEKEQEKRKEEELLRQEQQVIAETVGTQQLPLTQILDEDKKLISKKRKIKQQRMEEEKRMKQKDEEQTKTWHPTLRELVPVGNAAHTDLEDWRDH